MVAVEMQPPAAAVGSDGQGIAAVDSLNVSVATGILLHHMLASARGSA
jgi:hypothetical protein